MTADSCKKKMTTTTTTTTTTTIRAAGGTDKNPNGWFLSEEGNLKEILCSLLFVTTGNEFETQQNS